MIRGRLRPVAAAIAVSLGLLAPPRAQATDFHVHGILDVVGAEPGRAFEHNALIRGDSPFDAYSVRMFADAQVNTRLQIFTQFHARSGGQAGAPAHQARWRGSA